MAITLHENPAGKVLEVRVTDKLTHSDYQQFATRFETMFKQHGQLNVLFEMVSFHGWEAAAMWDELKFDLKHFSDIQRLAIVGDKQWEHAMSVLARPFTAAKVRYFDIAAINEARGWVETGAVRSAY
jgi:hypothetical protein